MVPTRRAFLMACLAPFPIAAATGARGSDPNRERAEIVEHQVLLLTNQMRLDRRLGVLEPSEALAAIARRHSQDMLDRGYFDHCTPEGLHSADRIALGGLDFGATGENIYMVRDAARSPASLAAAMVKGWMNSRDHRANILTPDYRVVGVGVIVAPRFVFATQLFGG